MKHPLFLLGCLFSCGLMAQTCSPGWGFYRDVTIDNSAGEALTDYQALIELDTRALFEAGNLRADGADLRVFTTDCTPLSFWGDSLGLSNSTKLYVKIPSLPAGGSVDLQIYYGRPQAESAADGESTFLFFDDFSSGTVDPGKWETVGEFAQFEVVDNQLLYGSTAMNPGPRFKFARTVPSFSDPVTFEFAGTISNSNGFGFSSADSILSRVIFRQSAFGADTINQLAIMQDTLSNGVALINNYPILRIPRGELTTHAITLGANANNHLEATRYANVGLGDENIQPQVLSEAFTVASGFHFIMSSFSASFPTRLNYLLVRQTTAIAPTATVGTEQMATPSSVRFLLSENDVKVFPNPANNLMRVEVSSDETFELFLIDALGRKVDISNSQQLTGAIRQLDVVTLSRGVYHLQLIRTADGALLHSRQVVIGGN